MIAKVQIFLYFLTLAGGSSQKIQNKAKNKAATLHWTSLLAFSISIYFSLTLLFLHAVCLYRKQVLGFWKQNA